MERQMPTNEADIWEVMRVLSAWNPLCDRASEVDELDNYRIEAQDILFHIRIGLLGESPVEVVQSVLNSAFNLSLTLDECRDPANQIMSRTSMHR
jgi:hypothetical protein